MSRVSQRAKSKTLDARMAGGVPLPFAAVHVADIAIVVLAHVLVHLLVRGPRDRPSADPGLGVRAGVVDGDFVAQVVVIDALELLGQMKLLGVRRTFAAEPEALIET